MNRAVLLLWVILAALIDGTAQAWPAPITIASKRRLIAAQTR